MRKISDENKESGPKIQLGEYWRIIWRKKYLLLIPLIIPVLVSVVGVGFLVPVYQSSSVIRMEDKMLLSKEVARFVQMEERRRMHDREALEYIKAELKTSGFLDQLIERLGLDKDPKLVRWANVQSRTRFPGLSANELIHRRLRNQLAKNIEADNAGPGMFQMSYFDYDPDVAYIVAEAITNVFIAMQQKKQLKGLQDASDFSDEQLALYREQLE
jgi:uncharacterized protein involved in exopolysaccharide biosynthesis